jgi:hypothetical protein
MSRADQRFWTFVGVLLCGYLVYRFFAALEVNR